MTERIADDGLNDRVLARVDAALLVALPDCTNDPHTLASAMPGAVESAAVQC